MMERTEAFDEEWTRSPHRPFVRAELRSPDDELLMVFALLDGRATYNQLAGVVTSSMTMTVVDIADELGVDEEDLVANFIYGRVGDTYGGLGGQYGVFSQTLQTGVLLPYGNEIVVRRGFEYADGTRETVSLGRWQIDDVSYQHSANAKTIRITGKDRSMLVQRNKWLRPYNVPAGTNFATLIGDLVEDRLGPFWSARTATVLDPIAKNTKRIAFGANPGGDPLSDITALARVNSKRVRFNRFGNFVLDAPADPDTTPEALVLQDGPLGTVVRVNRTYRRSNTYNGFVVLGERTDGQPPVRGQAVNTDPASPLRRNGPFGFAPKIITSPYITDDGQAQAYANTLFSENLGVFEEVDIDFIPHSALEVTDVVRLRFSPLAIDNTFAFSTLTVPFDLGLSTAKLVRRIPD